MKRTERLITAKEAARLSQITTTELWEYLSEIKEIFDAECAGEPNDNWATYCTMTACYEAGRVQGVREERKRKLEKQKRQALWFREQFARKKAGQTTA